MNEDKRILFAYPVEMSAAQGGLFGGELFGPQGAQKPQEEKPVKCIVELVSTDGVPLSHKKILVRSEDSAHMYAIETVGNHATDACKLVMEFGDQVRDVRFSSADDAAKFVKQVGKRIEGSSRLNNYTVVRFVVIMHDESW